MADPLTDDEVDRASAPDDGLPVALDDVIARYRQPPFQAEARRRRRRPTSRGSRASPRVLDALPDYRVTLDGNEQFDDVGGGRRDFGARCAANRALARLARRRPLLEQPLPRAIALASDVYAARRATCR